MIRVNEPPPPPDRPFADPPHAAEPPVEAPPPVTEEKPSRKARKVKVVEPKRPLLRRLFGISLWGAVKLVLLCILVGFFVMAANFDPANPSFNLGDALANMLRQTLTALGWAARNFWQPALAGALVVLPVWVIWRVISLPFRK